MKRSCGTLVPLIVAVLWSSACHGGQPTSHASPTAQSSITAATGDPGRCARLAQRGFTPCPPAPDGLPLPPATVRNATNGAVSDETAWRWGRAFLLTEAYYRWAVGSRQRQALTSGLLGDARASVNLFGPDLSDIDEALRRGGTLVDLPPGIVEIRLVTIPAELQDRMRAQQLTSRAFAFAVRLTGPASRSVRSPDGVERPLWSVDARQTQSLLIWGEYREDGDLGRIWYESGLYGCDGALRAICES